MFLPALTNYQSQGNIVAKKDRNQKCRESNESTHRLLLKDSLWMVIEGLITPVPGTYLQCMPVATPPSLDSEIAIGQTVKREKCHTLCLTNKCPKEYDRNLIALPRGKDHCHLVCRLPAYLTLICRA